jgi:hypothetical protein
MNFDALIDTFVEKVNAYPREPLYEYEIGPSVRLGASADEIYGQWDWAIKRYENIYWVENLETQLPWAFPESFRSLIKRYIFPHFEFAPIQFFGNTPEAKAELWELRTGIFKDKSLSKCLLEHGFIQFARPDTGDYDAICFDTNSKGRCSEYSIVRIDHKSILCNDKIRVTEILAPSFHEFIERQLEV